MVPSDSIQQMRELVRFYIWSYGVTAFTKEALQAVAVCAYSHRGVCGVLDHSGKKTDYGNKEELKRPSKCILYARICTVIGEQRAVLTTRVFKVS